jgi:2-polyprenyl-3-methyl-5-hydroxy-6-metoxy-1,4-benzoquinol methylase
MTSTTSAALDDRILAATLGTLELFGIYLGERLGLYARIEAAGGGLTPPALAEQAGVDPRYAREWLEQQAVAGVLTVDDVGADQNARRYELPHRHRGVLLDQTAPDHVAPFARAVVGIAQVLDEVVDAYRSGRGVPYARYGADFRHGQGGINRPAFITHLVDEWIPAAGSLADELRCGGRLADLGCGQGWSTIAVAQAFPAAEVWGVDNDVASIEDARGLARDHDVAVRFEAVDAAALGGHGPFDGILLLEVLHDLAQPVEVLANARRALRPTGRVIVADEAVAPAFTAPGDELERLMYGYSITHCLPASMAEQPTAATGTVIREQTVRSYAADAGFSSVEVLPVDGGFFRIYELCP